jgi:hypothetical protein
VDSVLVNQQYNENKVRLRARPCLGAQAAGQQRAGMGVVSGWPAVHSRETCCLVLTRAVQVSQWTSSCLENCIKRLTALNKPFKYVVTCIIMQKNGECTW